MKYKLLALDIDGTLVKEHTNILSENVVKAVKRASKIVHVSLVSARAWEDEEIIIDLLGLKGFYHVAENGTKVVNPGGDLEYNKHIPSIEVEEILDVTTSYFDDVGFCINSRWSAEYNKSESEVVSVLSLASSSREKALMIHSEINKLSNKYTVVTGAHWGKTSWAVTFISEKDASKGTGLKYIQKKLGVNSQETIAVGDGASDIYTMKYAGEKIAMGGAEIELKNIATFIAPTLAEDGVAFVIKKFLGV